MPKDNMYQLSRRATAPALALMTALLVSGCVASDSLGGEPDASQDSPAHSTENQNQLPVESPQEENSGDDENYVAGDTEPKTEQFETREILNEVDWLEEVGSTEQFIEASEPAGLREDGSGAFRTHCIESHLAEDDPLVWPGEPGQSHLHVFFGNPNVDAYTTSESLLDAEQTTCDGVSVNKSGYWVPALLNASGERIRYVDPIFYYKTGYHVPSEGIVPPPEGLKIIAGDMMSGKPQEGPAVNFRCSSWEAEGPQFDEGDPLDHVNYLPDCELYDMVEMRLVFPQCWDGESLQSSDYQSHMAYPVPAEAPNVGTGYCPESHPVSIPEISYQLEIRVTEETGPSSEWRFITDPPDAEQGGYTFHGDWMNGWDEEVMQTIVSNCLNSKRECMTGLLGNGKELQPVPLDG